MRGRALGLLGAAVLIGAAQGVLAGMVVLAAGLVSMRLAARVRQRALERFLAGELAAAMELAARAIRTGARLDDALREAGRLRGEPVSSILCELSERAREPRAPDGAGFRAVDVVGAVLAMVAGTGGGSARALEAGSQLLRDRIRMFDEVVAGVSQARASSAVLIAMPLMIATGALVFTPSVGSRLAAQPVVLASVSIGIAMECFGSLWSRALVRSVSIEAS